MFPFKMTWVHYIKKFIFLSLMLMSLSPKQTQTSFRKLGKFSLIPRSSEKFSISMFSVASPNVFLRKDIIFLSLTVRES